MALNAAYYAQPTHPRFLDIVEDSGMGGGDADGGETGMERLGGLILFPAVYNDGGVVVPVSYVQNAVGTLLAQFAAAGYAPEGGFLANVNGTAFANVTFMTSIAPLGPPPFGTAELITTMTFDGINNVTRFLVRLGP